MLIVDIDNHDGPLNAEEIDYLKMAGIQGAIVGLQYPTNSMYPPGVAHQQIPMLKAGGIEIVGCYAESQHIQDTWRYVEHLSRWIPEIWQACEEPHIDETWVDSSLQFISSIGKGRGIYTAPWWTNSRPWMQKYSNERLWVAQSDENYDPNTFTPFNGWTSCEIKQVTGTAHIGRLAVDLNVKW